MTRNAFYGDMAAVVSGHYDTQATDRMSLHNTKTLRPEPQRFCVVS